MAGLERISRKDSSSADWHLLSQRHEMLCWDMKQLGPPCRSHALGCEQLRQHLPGAQEYLRGGTSPRAPQTPQPRADCPRWGWGCREHVCAVWAVAGGKRKAKTKMQSRFFGGLGGMDIFWGGIVPCGAYGHLLGWYCIFWLHEYIRISFLPKQWPLLMEFRASAL